MNKSWYWRFTLVLGLIAIGFYYAAPSALYFFASPEVRRSATALKETIPDWLPDHRLNLGIDLQGGLHLVMGVDAQKAVEARTDRMADELSDGMKERGKPLAGISREPGKTELVIQLQNEADYETLREVAKDQRETWTLDGDGKVARFSMNESFQDTLRDDAVAQALKTLRNRIDKYGVTEPEVRRRGKDSILIQIAGLTADEEQSVKEEIIGQTAQLEFKVVDDSSDYFRVIAEKADKPKSVTLEVDSFEGPEGARVALLYLSSPSKEDLRSLVEQYPPPPDRVVRFQEMAQIDPESGAELSTKTWRAWLLERRTSLTGDSLVDAFVAFDSDENNYYVAVQFDRKGAVSFERLTRENIHRKMAIVLDDRVDSAPLIQSVIPNGNARITLGGFKSQDEVLADAKGLSIVLKAGALPAPVFPQEERTVGATLGDDAVNKGKLTLLVSLISVTLLMVVYYRFSGFVGVVALAANMLFLIAMLSGFDATLTLPGIAGLALTIGMAVDANVIQFERIRDELRAGKRVQVAVDAGFTKAFSAIFDANVTTLLAAIVLYQYGSGPIRGFATTLGIGVMINTFSAVVIPRLGLEWAIRAFKTDRLSI
jgi:preprotein translocase subunit SecD